VPAAPAGLGISEATKQLDLALLLGLELPLDFL
jgi:hypothetical protein